MHIFLIEIFLLIFHKLMNDSLKISIIHFRYYMYGNCKALTSPFIDNIAYLLTFFRYTCNVMFINSK